MRPQPKRPAGGVHVVVKIDEKIATSRAADWIQSEVAAMTSRLLTY